MSLYYLRILVAFQCSQSLFVSTLLMHKGLYVSRMFQWTSRPLQKPEGFQQLSLYASQEPFHSMRFPVLQFVQNLSNFDLLTTYTLQTIALRSTHIYFGYAPLLRWIRIDHRTLQ